MSSLSSLMLLSLPVIFSAWLGWLGWVMMVTSGAAMVGRVVAGNWLTTSVREEDFL